MEFAQWSICTTGGIASARLVKMINTPVGKSVTNRLLR